MDLDQALQASDPLGRTQFLIFAASVLMNMETGMTILSHVFLAEVPPHHCAYNSTYSLNESIPTDGSHYAQCEEYINPPFTNETQACSNGWTYDTKATGKSIVSDWDLVCDKDFLPGVSQSLLMAGFGLGSVIGGPLADVYGRRPTVIGSLILFNAIGLSVSLAPNFALFVILRHLMGGIFKSIRIPLINLMYEFLTPKHRPIMGLIPSLTTMLGYVLMTGFGYFVRDWRYFHLLIMSPCVILMAFSWFIPESVRWIISQGDMEKAEMTMQKVAKFNKATNFPNPVFSSNYSIDAGNASSQSSQAKEGESDSTINDDKPKRQTGVQAAVALFKQPVLTVTVVLSFEWVAGTMIFFGFTLTTGSLAGNPFVNFILICVVDLPARILAILLVKKIGNIKPLFFGFFGAGVTMVMIAILPYLVEDGESIGKVLTALAVLGKLCLGIAVTAIHLMVGELFPTTMRNSGTAVVHLIGNIGSLSTPLLLYLDKFFQGLSFIIMAVFAFTAMTISLILPDSRNTVQPETPADVQAMFDQKRRFRFGRANLRLAQYKGTDDGKLELQK